MTHQREKMSIFAKTRNNNFIHPCHDYENKCIYNERAGAMFSSLRQISKNIYKIKAEPVTHEARPIDQLPTQRTPNACPTLTAATGWDRADRG